MNFSKANLLVDFDGTVIDSGPGILNSIRFMLTELGKPVPGDEELRWCIGPGIQQVCARLFPGESPEYQQRAIRLFRGKYDTEGFLDTTLYPGILELLRRVKELGSRPFLTTMKGKPGVERLVRHFDLTKYFTAVHANDPYGPPRPKHQMIADVIKAENLDPDDTAIIGDTYHDMEAGKLNGIYSIGITWGYGKEEEIVNAGADVVVHSVRELGELLGA